jgi:epsin
VNWEKRRLERIIKMDLLGNIGEKVGLGNVDLDNIKKQASFFLRDKINSARLFLTDVTPSQL